eukprot:gnl/TRDRNA2_/TRDRNA2_170591_c2_seq1.p1 gnl/TRDRNA2_/TRDRNA2_170591_c2~~gnl/TRDRNA2_/TRDRNA2_170591_c2_seq1.p1  ORF type:complete len:114 (+),score=20.82 gnl/TRDRNA2_/TRDRNA2_170591_c2_seq1:44-343(+)
MHSNAGNAKKQRVQGSKRSRDSNMSTTSDAVDDPTMSHSSTVRTKPSGQEPQHQNSPKAGGHPMLQRRKSLAAIVVPNGISEMFKSHETAASKMQSLKC